MIYKILKLLFLFIVSVILMFMLSYIRAFDFRWHFIAAVIFGIALYYFARWKFRDFWLPLVIMLIPHLIPLTHAIIYSMPLDHFWIVFPGFIAVPLAVLIAHVLSHQSKAIKYAAYSVFGIFCLWIGFALIDQLIHLASFGSYSGLIEPVPITEISLTNEDGTLFEFSKTEQWYLLDFWHTRCGYCFKEFPKFQQVYEKSLDIENLEVFSVNFLLRNELPSEISQKIHDLDYGFDNLFYNGTREELYKHFRVSAFPSYLIVKNNQIVFLGSLANAEKFLNKGGIKL
nr:TlpA family protein disulfide reductase [Saprospiraceae bacterium]